MPSPSSWKEAIAVQKLGASTYECTLDNDWCIGSVPNGGYVVGCVLEVVAAHFSTTLSKQNQPHTIALHIEFLRRTQTGPATFKVEDVKLGRQTSTVHVRMYQEGREEILAYVTNSNMDTEEGYSLDTQYQLQPPPLAVDLVKLGQNQDQNWYWAKTVKHANFRKATQRVSFHLPRNGQPLPNVSDEWICYSDGSNFTNSSIGYAADMFPQIIEEHMGPNEGPFWFPTLLLNLDIKKTLPPEGVKWLRVRAETKQVKNGRFDLEVYIYDERGDLVALSHHVSMILSVARNIAARKKTDPKM